MTTRCPEDGELFDDDSGMCDTHVCATEPVVVAEETAQAPPTAEPADVRDGVGPERESWTAAVCWRCDTPSPNPTNTECLNPDCRRALTPPALYIRFRDGEVELARGERAELGRHGPHARLFRAYTNVSRRHAVVGVETGGRAFLEPLPTPNGTFVNGKEIAQPASLTLFTGDAVRFALHAEGTVTLYDR
jgi:hypothetical protein